MVLIRPGPCPEQPAGSTCDLLASMERTPVGPGARTAAWLGLLLLLGAAGCSPSTAPAWKGPTGGPSAPGPGGSVSAFELTAAATTIELAPGMRVHAWAFDGTVPGPTLRVRQGDLVRVTLRNRLPVGTTLHWHGVAVPNGEDGVPGVTQDAVPPGGTAVYSFVARTAGTYWYHSHQDSAAQVDRGLYGTLVIDPREAPRTPAEDETLVLDEWPFGLERSSPPPAQSLDMDTYVTYTVNGRTGTSIAPVRFQPGQEVRLRMVNAGYLTHLVQFPGLPVTISEVGGRPVSRVPATEDAIPLAASDRLTVVFTAPAQPAWLVLADGFPPAEDVKVPLLPEGFAVPAPPAAVPATPSMDLYGLAAETLDSSWPAGAVPDRRFTLQLSEDFQPGPGPRDQAGTRYLVNGQAYPKVPALTVRQGDLVELTLVDAGRYEHPIHLHGHSMRLLARDGRPLPGALVVDTVLVRPGSSITVGFVADNPGWWMLHCHQLHHSAGGMMLLIDYEGTQRLAQPRAGSMPE